MSVINDYDNNIYQNYFKPITDLRTLVIYKIFLQGSAAGNAAELTLFVIILGYHKQNDLSPVQLNQFTFSLK